MLDQPKGTVWSSVGVLLEAPPLLTVLFQHDYFRLLMQSQFLCLRLRALLAPGLVLARSCALPLPTLVPAWHGALRPSVLDKCMGLLCLLVWFLTFIGHQPRTTARLHTGSRSHVHSASTRGCSSY